MKWHMGPLENALGANRESLNASIAAVISAIQILDPLDLLAMWANSPFRPAIGFNILACRFFIWEHFGKLKSADC
jgi:hypothetical protein